MTALNDKQRWMTVLVEITELLLNYKIAFFLDMGTLLGAVRENAFIPWDNDMDLGVILDYHKEDQINRFVREVYKNGYNVNYSSNGIGILGKDGLELNIAFYRESSDAFISEYLRFKCSNSLLLFLRNVRRGTHIKSLGHDLKYLVKKAIIQNKTILQAFKVNAFDKWVVEEKKIIFVPKRFFIKSTEVLLYGLKFPAPANVELYLEHRYGVNWRIPVSNYNYFLDDKAISQ